MNILNKKSGVLGVSGVSSDFRDIESAAAEGNKRAQLALDMFCYKTTKRIASASAAMGGVDAVVFTAGVGQDWVYDSDGAPLYWPVDDYFRPGERKTHFLGCDVAKQHHTLTQILNGLLERGFALTAVEEAMPPREMLDIPGMKDELRRPMMLLVRAQKN